MWEYIYLSVYLTGTLKMSALVHFFFWVVESQKLVLKRFQTLYWAPNKVASPNSPSCITNNCLPCVHLQPFYIVSWDKRKILQIFLTCFCDKFHKKIMRNCEMDAKLSAVFNFCFSKNNLQPLTPKLKPLYLIAFKKIPWLVNPI